MHGRGPVLALAAAAALACSAEQTKPKASHGIETPLSASTLSAPQPAPERNLDFRSFTRFLAAPQFEAARVAYDDGRYEDALSLFEATVGQALQHDEADVETCFQLGHLRSKAGHTAEAAQAFESAARSSWALSAYARYFAAVAYDQAGAKPAALALLDDTPETVPFRQNADLLRAELLLDLDRRAEGIAQLRSLLAADPKPLGWASASLRLSAALLDGAAPGGSSSDLPEALDRARHVAIELAGTPVAADATELEQRVLAAMTPEEFAKYEPLTPKQELVRLGALVDQRKWADANVAADELINKLNGEQAFSSIGCEARLLRAKAQGGLREWGKAVDQLGDAVAHCQGEDLRARLLFVVGKYAQFDKRYSAAIRAFAALESEAPTHRLADDARIRRAESYRELGDDAKFTELLSTITLDYPDGDVALDGLFELALQRIEKGDWAQAANVLERAFPRADREDRVRDHEYAGRERYFRARAWFQLGQVERSLAEFERLVTERPLSYYMLLALSRLEAVDAPRAERAFARAIAQTESAPFSFPHRPEFDGEVFQRALALARQGELDWAQRELESLSGLDQPELLWAIALSYGRAGAPDRAQALARGKLTDWLVRWPTADWRTPWELAFPRPYHDIVKRAARAQSVPEALVYAVMREESAFRPEVVSPADAYGLMQLIQPTARHFGKKLGLPYDARALKRPSVNIALGTAVLGNYGGAFPDDPLLAIPSYNAGPGRPKRWLKERPGLDFDVWVELIPFTETRRYTKRVLSSRGAYTFLYQDEDPADLRLPLRFSED